MPVVLLIAIAAFLVMRSVLLLMLVAHKYTLL